MCLECLVCPEGPVRTPWAALELPVFVYGLPALFLRRLRQSFQILFEDDISRSKTVFGFPRVVARAEISPLYEK